MGKYTAVAGLAVMLVSCRNVERPNASDADTPENQAIMAKLQGYLDCLREHSVRVFQVADHYRERAAATVPRVVPVQATMDPAECVSVMSVSRALPPSSPVLEVAGDEFVKAITEMFALTSAGPSAAAQPKLLAAFSAFDQVQGRLSDEVRRLNLSVRESQLARRENKDGRTLLFLMDQMMFHAEELVRRGAIRWDRLEKLDLTALASELAAFENVAEELHTRALSNPDETIKSVPDLSIISAAVKAYTIAARQLAARARDNIPYSGADTIMIRANNEEAVIGTPAALTSAYNRLVSAYLFQ